MKDQLTLPALQIALDCLPVNAALTISQRERERLFGLNDVGAARVENFARGHRCRAVFNGNILTFWKTIPFPKVESEYVGANAF